MAASKGRSEIYKIEFDPYELHSKHRIRSLSAFEFGDVAYWDLRYHKEGQKGKEWSFEWYIDAEHARAVVTPLLAEYRAPRVLVLGCGNSQLSQLLYEDGIRNITNLDFSCVVVSQMRQKYGHLEGMTYVCAADILPDQHFDAIIDKGCLDAIFARTTGFADAHKALEEAQRLLKPGGRLFHFTYATESARRHHLKDVRYKWSVEHSFLGGSSSVHCYILWNRNNS